MELNSCVCGIIIYFSINSQINEKVAFSSKETYDFQVLENTLIIAGYKAIKISIFHLFCNSEGVFVVRTISSYRNVAAKTDFGRKR